MKFRKRPVVIEAIQFDGTNIDEVLVFAGRTDEQHTETNVIISTLEGDMMALPGDWIIRGVKGEYYPVKDAIFAETYEPVDLATDDLASRGWDAGTAPQEAS